MSFLTKKKETKNMMCDNMCQWLSNCQMNRNRRNFFSVKWKKLWVVPTLPPTLWRVFSVTFSTWFSSLTVSQFFKLFFSTSALYTAKKNRRKKWIYGPCEHTSIYQLWFSNVTSIHFLFFYEVAQFLPIYCSNVYKYDLLRRW